MLQVYLTVLGLEKKDETEVEDVKRSIKILSCPDACIVTVVICSQDSDIRSGRLQ